MRTRTILIRVTLLGIGAWCLAAPAQAVAAPGAEPSPSTAASPVSFKVGPDFGGDGYVGKARVARGGQLQVGAPCFTEQGGVAESTAFGSLSLKRGDGGSGAKTTVRPGAALGDHAVTVRCAEGTTARGVLTVYEPQTTRKPAGGAATGGGGGATDSTALAAMTAAAAMGGLGAAAVGVRRRGRRRG